MVPAQRVTTPMTVDEFRSWAARQPGQWELVNGQRRAMSPASSTHGFIQARAAYLVERHIEASGNPCRSATEPPVTPAAYKRHNARAPDLGVTCAPPSDDWELMRPVFLLEILSPTNEQDTRDNVWAYMTIPSVQQILLVDSTAVRGAMTAPGRRSRSSSALTMSSPSTPSASHARCANSTREPIWWDRQRKRGSGNRSRVGPGQFPWSVGVSR
jgi:Uma2 family endonuclease